MYLVLNMLVKGADIVANSGITNLQQLVKPVNYYNFSYIREGKVLTATVLEEFTSIVICTIL